MNIKSILFGIVFVLILGVIGFYGYQAFYLNSKRIEAEKLMKENYVTYKDKSGKFSFKYNKIHTITQEQGVSRITVKEINEGFEKTNKTGEIPTPSITFEIVSKMPEKIIPEAKDFTKLNINNLEVYKGELVPAALENRVYFVKLKDGTYLQFLISPFLSDVNDEFLKNSYSRLDSLINDILLSVETY